MEYQKIINLIDNMPDTKTMPKFNIKKWAEVNDQSGRTYNTNKQIRFKTPMLWSDLCDFSIFTLVLNEQLLLFIKEEVQIDI